MPIVWLSRALRQIAAAHAYIAIHDPKSADRVVRRIHEAVRHLSEHPMIGRPGSYVGLRELVVTGTRYIVTYRVRHQTVEILTVVHHARHPSRRL